MKRGGEYKDRKSDRGEAEEKEREEERERKGKGGKEG